MIKITFEEDASGNNVQDDYRGIGPGITGAMEQAGILIQRQGAGAW